jgi:hypothetical protein
VIKVDVKNQIDKYLGIYGVSNKYIDVLLYMPCHRILE